MPLGEIAPQGPQTAPADRDCRCDARSLVGSAAEGWRRSASFERLRYHAQQLERSSGPLGLFRQLPTSDQDLLIRAWIDHAAMRQKYQNALPIPLRYVEPDPQGRNDWHVPGV
jgi:hypothetical protein